jgi:hypothetical protein
MVQSLIGWPLLLHGSVAASTWILLERGVDGGVLADASAQDPVLNGALFFPPLLLNTFSPVVLPASLYWLAGAGAASLNPEPPREPAGRCYFSPGREGAVKYSNEIDIDLPREKVIEKFDNVENLKCWMHGLVAFEPLEGKPGQVGAKSRLRFRTGRREMVMVETITKRNLPDEFDGIYEADGVWNAQKNRFVDLGPGRTRWISETEFRFTGFMKIIAFLMPGAFRRQSRKFMVYFKEFAETGKRAQ